MEERRRNNYMTTGMATQRVLVVDDNRDSATSLALLMKYLGHTVETAFDGPAALATAAKFNPAIVLLDIGLPGLNGYDVARSLRQDPLLKNVVLIAQTGWGQEEDRRKSREAGFDGHLVKPVDFNVLLDLISTSLVARSR